MAGSTMEASGTGTVINVLAAILPSPAIDAHTVVAPVGVVAGSPILAGIGHELALIHILCAVLTCEGWVTVNPRGCHTQRSSLPGAGL
jgi:hypothetical protein